MKKGFTLIELLIVIAIIGILAGVILVSTSSAKNKATASVTKQTLDSLKSVMAVCCSDPSGALVAAAGEVCAPAIGVVKPTPADLKATTAVYAITTQCSGTDPEMSVTLTGHPLTACNAAWSLKLYGGLTPPAGC